jgi:hypothetical protein
MPLSNCELKKIQFIERYFLADDRKAISSALATFFPI